MKLFCISIHFKKSYMNKDYYYFLTPEEKKLDLFLRQKRTLDLFLERNAIFKAQYDKSLGDLIEKMGMERVLRETGEALVLPCRKPLI